MPELPEVETIRRGLQERVAGRTVLRVRQSRAALRQPSPLPLRRLVGQRIGGLRRHAKILYWDLDHGTLESHLGMTGKWLFATPDEEVPAHTHLQLSLDDGQELRYIDPRRFGWVALHAPGAVPAAEGKGGIDALSPALTDAALEGLLRRSRAPLKVFLLDQSKVAGLGNIYVAEALWRARLSPRRRAQATPRAKVPLLRQAIVDVLEDSLKAGGTSFNDYVSALGTPGTFIARVAVFQREGEPCLACGAAIRRFVQAGRSTFACLRCQR